MSRTIATTAPVAIAGAAVHSIACCARHTLPDECCGVLIGRDGEQTVILEAWPLPNRAAANRARRFALAPVDLHKHAAHARQFALDIVGFFHSHPTGAATPSVHDIRNGGAWPGYVNAIYACAPAVGDRSLRVYRTGWDGWKEVAVKGLHQ